MANSPSPWSVKGVEPEAREAAKIAARKAGLTVGAWLTQMIRQSASDQLRSGGNQTPPPEATGYDRPHSQHYPSQHPGQANEQYFSGNQPPPQQPGYAGGQPPPPGGAPPPAPTMQAVFESIQRLASRIESAEQRTAFFRRTATAGAAARATIRSALRSPRPPLRCNPWRRRLAVCRIILTGPNAGATENCRCRTSHRGAPPTACNVINHDTVSTGT